MSNMWIANHGSDLCWQVSLSIFRRQPSHVALATLSLGAASVSASPSMGTFVSIASPPQITDQYFPIRV